jgi:hypothetical protein
MRRLRMTFNSPAGLVVGANLDISGVARKSTC